MELNNLQILALIGELKKDVYVGKTVTEAYDILHKSSTVKTIEKRKKKITVTDALSVLSTESAYNIAVNPNATDLRDKIMSQDIAGVTLWVQLFTRAGIIKVEEAGKLQEVLNGQDEEFEVETIVNPRISSAFIGISGMPNLIKFEDFKEVFDNVGR